MPHPPRRPRLRGRNLNSAYGSTSFRPEVGTAIGLIRDCWRPDLVLAAGDLIRTAALPGG
jgi:hypothetical protein